MVIKYWCVDKELKVVLFLIFFTLGCWCLIGCSSIFIENRFCLRFGPILYTSGLNSRLLLQRITAQHSQPLSAKNSRYHGTLSCLYMHIQKFLPLNLPTPPGTSPTNPPDQTHERDPMKDMPHYQTRPDQTKKKSLTHIRRIPRCALNITIFFLFFPFSIH